LARMVNLGDRFLRLAALAATMLWAWAIPACNVPVSRYALERWEADPYEIMVFHQEPYNTAQQALLERLEKTGRDGSANLSVSNVNVSAQMPESLRALWAAQANPTLPWMVVKYPRKTRIELPAWAGPLTAETVGALLESPARQDIGQRLLRGDAVVWLLLESGGRRRDDETAQLLEAQLRKLEQSLVLPEPSPLDPPINTNLPLKIVFSTLRLARTNPAESMLVSLLLNWNTNLVAEKEVMLFPIFGRGRFVPPATGEEIQPEAIREMAEFLTGPCSCEVKEMNPGYDLLLSANWKSLGDYQPELMSESPPLTGLSQFAAGATNDPKAQSGQSTASLAAAYTATQAPGHLVRNLVVVLGIGIVSLAAATLLLKARGGRRPR
jgi:hypothetical protein